MNLAALMPLGGECSPVRFFEPEPKFFEQMKAFRGLDIIDVGAGQGHVTAALRAHGHDVIPIDVRPDGAEVDVIEANAALFSYPAGAVAMFCRPCHGEFVCGAIERMLECDVAAILYVGLTRNVENDLGRYRRRFRIGARKVGQAGENLYIYQRRNDAG